jgi:hypothetical protein
VGQQALLNAHDLHVREFETLATMHGDQRHGIAMDWILLVPRGIEGQFLERHSQTIGRYQGQAALIQRGGKIEDISHPVLGRLRVAL